MSPSVHEAQLPALLKLPRAVHLHRQGRLVAAQEIYQEILEACPDHFEALHLLGVLAHQRGREDAAEQLIRQALAQRPDSSAALNNLGTVLKTTGRFQEALDCYDRALALDPDSVAAHSNRGVALQRLQRLDAALDSYDQALALDPDCVDALINRGSLLHELKRLPEAIAAYERALALDPSNAKAHTNLGMALLYAGDFIRGLPEYEWRHRDPDFPDPGREFDEPLWLGDAPVESRTILIHSEQGLGDVIQMSRYAPLVAARGARVVLEAAPALVPLLRPLPGVAEVVEAGEPLPAFDFHCPVFSLPLACGTGREPIPSPGGYLEPDPVRLALWAARLGPRRGLRVGLAWRGNPRHNNDASRSLALETLLDYLPASMDLVSLQKEMRREDLPALRGRAQLRHFGDEIRDFADTAALCHLVDVVVSVDTSVAHLAGALGRPTWVVLAHRPDWRWGCEGDTSPWYDGVRLYRQPRDGDWDTVLARVNADLRALARAGQATAPRQSPPA